MQHQEKLFLIASRDSLNSLTTLFDFVWPTSAALWNLQWQVKGFIAQVPNATTEDLKGRFLQGSEISNSNFHRLANQQTWPELQQWFARLLLSETCALFEGWIEAAFDELAIPSSLRKNNTRNSLDKKIQFNTKVDASGIPIDGANFALTQICGTGSNIMRLCFLPTQQTNKKLGSNIDNALKCYRAFKEARNDFTHHGGRASKRTVDAITLYHKETASSLGVKEMPIIPMANLDKPIELSLRGVVGFSDIVVRIISALDIALSDSTFAENLIVSRWIEKHKGRILVKANPLRDSQIRKLAVQSGLPRPVNEPALYQYLYSQQLVA
ncbi:hypothetical protein ACJJWD_13860 [Comamonas testosteroni]|uniref:hypothetical protein n=1 Tax=Comamonas testosteroni TaxID=285 RepID=UPI00389A2A37